MTNNATEPVICKAAAVVTKATDDADLPYGSFEVILSTPTVDRDGEEVKAEEWKMPLPDHITFDVDHGMSVATTVGSGTPELDDKGRMIVKGRWASTPLAQQTRALVNEGHIRTTSVAFLRLAQEEDGKGPRRELLNGAFVPVPANAEALVLNSKGLQDQLAKINDDEPPAPTGNTDPAEKAATDPEGSTSASDDAEPAADKAADSASEDAETRALEADAIAKARALAEANSNLLAIEFGQ